MKKALLVLATVLAVSAPTAAHATAPGQARHDGGRGALIAAASWAGGSSFYVVADAPRTVVTISQGRRVLLSLRGNASQFPRKYIGLPVIIGRGPIKMCSRHDHYVTMDHTACTYLTRVT